MKLNSWLAFLYRSRPPQFGADFRLHRAPAPEGPLRAPRAVSRRGLCLGQRLLGPARRSLSMGRAAGTVRLIKELAGPVLATSTTSKAGRCVKVTGTVTSMVGAAITSVVAA